MDDVDTEVLLSGNYDALDDDIADSRDILSSYRRRPPHDAHADAYIPNLAGNLTVAEDPGDLDIDGFQGMENHSRKEPIYLDESGIDEMQANLQEVVEILNELQLGFNPAFARMFGTFMRYVYVQYPEHATAADYEMVGAMADIVQAIVVFQNGTDDSQVHEVIAGLREIHDHVCSMQVPKPASVLLRLVCMEHHLAAAALSRCVRQWSLAWSKTQASGPDLAVRRLFRRWRAKKERNSLLTSQASQYSHKRIQAQFFNHWISRVLQALQQADAADGMQTAKYFRGWQARYAHFHGASASFRAQSLQRRAFLVLLSKHAQNAQNASAAAQLYRRSQVSLMHSVFQTWSSRLVSLTHSEEYMQRQELSRRLAQMMKQRYFGLIKKKYAAVQNLRLYHDHARIRTLQVVFGRMVHMTSLSRAEQELRFRMSASLKARILGAWRSRLAAEQQVAAFWRRNSLKRCMSVWQLRARLKNIQEVLNRKLLARFLQQWRLRARACIHKPNRNMAAEILAVWVEKWRVIEHQQALAASLNNSAVQKRAFLTVRFKAEVIAKELDEVADLNFLRIHFGRWKTAHRRVLCMQTRPSGSTFIDTLDKRVVLLKWRRSYLERYESAADLAISDFQANFHRKHVLRVFIRAWRDHSHRQQQRKRELQRNLVFFNSTNILKSEVFLLWMEKSTHYSQLQHRGEEFYDLVLRKRFTSFWYQKYSTKALYLQSVAEDMINNRDYMTTRNFLHKWSFKHTKNVRRNQQSCELFQEKWHRAHLRSFWELWRYKHIKEPDATINDSFQSFTISPLHRKNPLSRQDSDLLPQSYLQTPIKLKQTPFTPAHHGHSPTRLQETNQRMRSSKMDALVSRYRNASLASVQRARLSPPKKQASVLPPPPPKFSDSAPSKSGAESSTNDEESGIFIGEAHFSASQSVMAPNATSSPGNDRDLVENAKLLRKIKPIKVPFEPEIKYSSPRRLRERFSAISPEKRSQTSIFD